MKIFQEFWIVLEKFWYELLDVARVRLATVPLFIDAFEQSVWVVELASLELDHPLRVLSHQEADHIPWAAVVRPVQVSVLLGQLKVARFKLFQALQIHRSDRQRQISVDLRILQVQDWRLKISQNPWKDRILCQIESTSLRIRVNNRQVVIVRQVSFDPLARILHNRGLLRSAVRRQVVIQLVVHHVPLCSIRKSQEQAPSPTQLHLQPDLHELESPLEELLELPD